MFQELERRAGILQVLDDGHAIGGREALGFGWGDRFVRRPLRGGVLEERSAVSRAATASAPVAASAASAR